MPQHPGVDVSFVLAYQRNINSFAASLHNSNVLLDVRSLHNQYDDPPARCDAPKLYRPACRGAVLVIANTIWWLPLWVPHLRVHNSDNSRIEFVGTREPPPCMLHFFLKFCFGKRSAHQGVSTFEKSGDRQEGATFVISRKRGSNESERHRE